MAMFRSRKNKKGKSKNVSKSKPNNKEQFNIIIGNNIKEEVQKMAKILRINQSQMSEHLFEVGLHHTNNTLTDSDKRKLLERHMEINHILGECDQDEDVVIRMTENNRNWILLDHTRQVVDQMARITSAIQKAFMRNDNETFANLQKELNRLVAGYTNWVMNFEGDEE